MGTNVSMYYGINVTNIRLSLCTPYLTPLLASFLSTI